MVLVSHMSEHHKGHTQSRTLFQCKDCQNEWTHWFWEARVPLFWKASCLAFQAGPGLWQNGFLWSSGCTMTLALSASANLSSLICRVKTWTPHSTQGTSVWREGKEVDSRDILGTFAWCSLQPREIAQRWNYRRCNGGIEDSFHLLFICVWRYFPFWS